jgi:outer membrane protein OmpA-like peptidoglycan-associated protein
MSVMQHKAALASLLLATAATMSWGQAPAGPVKDASVDDIVKQLAPPAATTRSLRNLVPERRQIDLVIPFDFDSARLQATSRPQLERLAEALRSERLQSLRFKVEGHTDAKGTAKYNDELSARRARAVVEFLAAQGVEPSRLDAEGKGFREPLRPEDPTAAENRRVRIATIP